MQRTTFIEWFPKWSGNVAALKAVLDAADDDASLRSGISLALGSLTEVSAETKQAWEPVLANWHTRHPDSGVHSAAGWALRSWGLSPPTIESQDDLREGFNWRVTKMGLTLLRIPAGHVERPAAPRMDEDRKTIRIEKEFWLSDREVTVGQFQQFLNDKDAEKPDKPEEIAQSNTARSFAARGRCQLVRRGDVLQLAQSAGGIATPAMRRKGRSRFKTTRTRSRSTMRGS